MNFKVLQSFAVFITFTQPIKFSGVQSMWIGDSDTTCTVHTYFLHGYRKTQKKQSTDSLILLIFSRFTYIKNFRFSVKVLGF